MKALAIFAAGLTLGLLAHHALTVRSAWLDIVDPRRSAN